MSQHLYVPAAQGHRNRTSALAASSSSSLSIRLFPLSVDSPALQWTQIQTVPVLQRNKGWNSFFGTRRNRIYLECGSNSNLYPGPQTALCDVIKGTSLIVRMIRHNTVKFVLTNAFFSHLLSLMFLDYSSKVNRRVTDSGLWVTSLQLLLQEDHVNIHIFIHFFYGSVTSLCIKQYKK